MDVYEMTSTVYNDISKLKNNNITAFFLVIHTQVSFESSALNHLWSSLFPQNPFQWALLFKVTSEADTMSLRNFGDSITRKSSSSPYLIWRDNLVYLCGFRLLNKASNCLKNSRILPGLPVFGASNVML